MARGRCTRATAVRFTATERPLRVFGAAYTQPMAFALGSMLPALALGVPAVFSTISSLLDIAGKSHGLAQLSGSGYGRMRYRRTRGRRGYGRVHHRRYRRGGELSAATKARLKKAALIAAAVGGPLAAALGSYAGYRHYRVKPLGTPHAPHYMVPKAIRSLIPFRTRGIGEHYGDILGEGLAVMNKYPLISRPHQSRWGGRAGRRRR